MTSARATTLAGGAWIGVAALCGCPQLLDDSFDVAPALPATNLDSDLDLPHIDGDAGIEPGTGGAGGMTGALGTAGSAGAPSGGGSSGSDASAAGAAGSDPNSPPDGGGPPPPATELGALLAHRYRFDGTGSMVSDSVGTANGTTVGMTVIAGSDKVSLSGNEQFVDLPNGLISGLESVTVEAWVNWLAEPTSTGAEWQSVFDFGATALEGSQGQATTRLYLTAKSSVSGHLRAGYTLDGYDNELFVDATRALPVSSDPARGTQVVLVANGVLGSLAVYVDGALEASTANGQAIDLSSISDVNDWLGLSQYAADPDFQGEILDFRIYAAPLSAAQVGLSFSLGADAEL